MGGRGRGGGKGRGRGGGRHHDHGDGSGGRGRGRRGSGTGFVRGVALGDWENITPDRRQSGGRGGRTPEGVNAGSRHPTSSSRRGSQSSGGVARPAQNPFTFVSFDYSQLDRKRGALTSRAHKSPLSQEVETVASFQAKEVVVDGRVEEVETVASFQAREVVVPAVEGRVEVYMDRKGSLEASDVLDLGFRTTGLGFVDQDSAVAETSGNIADFELNSVEDRNVAALEAMKVDNPVDDKNFRSTPRNKKNSRGISFETSPVVEKNAGYLSIGGLKIFTEAGITYSDESEDLDEESDVCLELDYASGKKRRNKGGGKSSGVNQRGQWLEETFSGSGESIIDSSDSDVDDDLVADYIANVEGAEQMLDDTWLLKNKLHHAAIEDMGSEDSEDEDEDEDDTSSDASGSDDDDSSDSACASPEKLWSLKQYSKGKELMEIDDDDDEDDSDSELEDMAERKLFGDSVRRRRGRKSKTAALLRNLELEDSEEDSEDEDGVDQLFDLMEDANFTPDTILNISRSGKLSSGSIGKSIDPAVWPLSVNKSKKKSKRAPGEKKRERKDMIAAKRQERAVRRGLDLPAINSAMEEIVSNGTDIYAFAPMEDRDRAQIHKMAAIYRLKSGSQGSGKKRFTVVTRTKHTSLPTGADKYRLAAMLDQGHSSGALTGEDRRMAKKFKNAARQAFIGMQAPVTKRNGKRHQKFMQGEGFIKLKKSKKGSSGPNSMEKSGGKKIRTPKYANNPMSFISSGIIGNEEDSAAIVSTEVVSYSRSESGEASTSSRAVTVVRMKVAASAMGTFEAHTKGFGSRMMSKMGFVEGQGLGRDRQGICSPLEAVKRAKNLGLGAYAPPPPPS